jgi:hypothetical protein
MSPPLLGNGTLCRPWPCFVLSWQATTNVGPRRSWSWSAPEPKRPPRDSSNWPQMMKMMTEVAAEEKCRGSVQRWKPPSAARPGWKPVSLDEATFLSSWPSRRAVALSSSIYLNNPQRVRLRVATRTFFSISFFFSIISSQGTAVHDGHVAWRDQVTDQAQSVRLWVRFICVERD